MKGIFTRLAAVFLAAALVTPAAQAAGTEADPIQVGLAYGSGALVNANLENNTGYGAGYRLGYFDRDLDFVELGRTGSKETRITVVKAQNTWVNGSSYANSDNGGAVIGSYHLQVETCASYEEAARAAEDYRDGFPAWIDGEYQVRSGAYATREEAEDAQSRLGEGTIVGTSSYGVNVTRTGTDEILFQFDGGDGLALGVLPDVTGEDEVRTWFKGNRYYGGFRYERIGGGDLTVVNRGSGDLSQGRDPLRDEQQLAPGGPEGPGGVRPQLCLQQPPQQPAHILSLRCVQHHRLSGLLRGRSQQCQLSGQ